MGLPNNNIQTAIQEYGAAAILREILKQRPDLEEQILELVVRVGIDAAVMEIFGLQAPPPIEQPAPVSALPAQGAQPELPPAFKATEMDMPQVTSGLQSRQGPAVELAVGGAQPQQISPGIQPEVTDVMMDPGDIDISVSQTPAMPATVPEPPVGPPVAPAISEPVAQPALAEFFYQPGEGASPEQDFSNHVTATVDVANFSKQCAKYGVPVQLMLALIKAESTFNPNKIGEAGEIGLTQLMRGTATDRGLLITTKSDERFDPKKNIIGGLKHMKWLKGYKPKTVDAWLAAYNAGHTKLIGDKWKDIGSTKIYVNRIKETVKSYQENPQFFAEDMNRLMKAVGGSSP